MTANTTASVRAFADRRWLCLISAMVICVCAGFGYAWSVLQTPIIARFGWADSGGGPGLHHHGGVLHHGPPLFGG